MAAQLVAPNMHKGVAAPGSSWIVPDVGHPLRPEGYGRAVTAESVSKLCEQGQVEGAIEALGVLVRTDRHITASLFYHVLRECVVKKDLPLGRRVHALSVKQGYESDTFVCSHILRMYASHARLQEATDVFAMLAKPDAFAWSAIISAHVKLGQDKQAIRLYHQMRKSSVKPDGHVFVAALHACARGLDLESGQQVHAHVLATGVECDLFVCSCLVDMYAKCGSLEDAQRVFDGLPQKDVVVWNAMIAGYSQHGRGQEALRLYASMQQGRVALPNSVTFVSLLLACASLGSPALEEGKQLHAQIRERGLQADPVVGGSLVNMYAKCGSLEDARAVFDRLVGKNAVTWNAMIAGYSQNGMGQEALCLYGSMQQIGMAAPNSATFVSLLQACAGVGTAALEKGTQLHVQIKERGLQADVVVGGSLVNMYAKCGRLEDARGVFDGLGQKNVVTWNAMIAAYSQQGMEEEAFRLYRTMQEEGIVAPDAVTFASLLQACASLGTPALEKGRQLHAQIRERGLQADTFVGSSLVHMYAKCDSLDVARTVFDGLCTKNVVTWSAMIAGYSQQGMGQEALHLYNAMEEEGSATPNSVTFVCLLQACGNMGTLGLEKGKQLHAQIKERDLQADVFVANSLVSMYSKCNSLVDAHILFDGLAQKNVVTWNAMIAGYSQQGMGQEALRLYRVMQEEGIVAPDCLTFVSLLQACATVGHLALERGKQLHAQIKERGLQADMFVACSLVSMYAKCGSIHDAQGVFDGLPQKDVATWSAMIAGYAQKDMGQQALRLYRGMQEEGIAASDSVTFVSLLQVCANVAALQLGRQLHAQIKEQGLQADVLVGGSLINMYGKCGSMGEAQQVFEALSEKDEITWNALMAGYVHQGDSEEVFNLLLRMRKDGIQPDGVTFLSVLTVCGHTGLVKEGREYFEAMSRDYGITPGVEHYTCMVDLLGRAGQVEDALALVHAMPVPPDAAVWHTLLSACRKWSNVEVGQSAFNEAMKLDKQDTAAYLLMWNVYIGAQMWERAQGMRSSRSRIRARKQPGQSWWTDMHGLVHSFSVGVKSILGVKNADS